MTEGRTREPSGGRLPSLTPGRGAIVLLGTGWVVFLRLTTTSPEGDFFDAPLFWWSWLVLATVAWLGTLTGLERSPIVWGVCVMFPSMLWAFVAGGLLHDPDHGASLWLAGEVILMVLAGLIAAAAALGLGSRWVVLRLREGGEGRRDARR